MKVLRFLGRLFIKITGLIPYLIFAKPKFMYASEKAKKEFKNNKRGAILVSNHTSIFDYYVLVYKFFFNVVHTMVADVVYQKKGLTLLNNVMENIKIHRDGTPNVNAVNKSANYLRKNKLVFIFPEGKLEDKPGKLEDFTNSAAYLAITENRKVTPMFIDGNYGIFKRVHCIVGEPIMPKVNATPTDEDFDELTEEIRDSISTLKSKQKSALKYKTKTIFTFRYWLLDAIRIVSFPMFYLLFITKKYYLGNRKDIRKALRYNCILAGNHFGPMDPFFIFMHFMQRRERIIAAEQLYDIKTLAWALPKGGAIKYHRDSMNKIDIDAFKEAIGTLEGNGVIGIFPEGHINFSTSMDDTIKGGSALMSIMTNSPIVPFVFVNAYRVFNVNKVVIGEPIYPHEYVDYTKPITNDTINNYNLVVYNKLKVLYDESIKRRTRDGDKRNPYKAS